MKHKLIIENLLTRNCGTPDRVGMGTTFTLNYKGLTPWATESKTGKAYLTLSPDGTATLKVQNQDVVLSQWVRFTLMVLKGLSGKKNARTIQKFTIGTCLTVKRYEEGD